MAGTMRRAKRIVPQLVLTLKVKQCPRSKPLPRPRPACTVASSARLVAFGSTKGMLASSRRTARNEFSARRSAQCVGRCITRLGSAVTWPPSIHWSSPKRRQGGSHDHVPLSGARWLHAPRRHERRGTSGRYLQSPQASDQITRLAGNIRPTHTLRLDRRPRQSSQRHAAPATARSRTSSHTSSRTSSRTSIRTSIRTSQR